MLLLTPHFIYYHSNKAATHFNPINIQGWVGPRKCECILCPRKLLANKVLDVADTRIRHLRVTRPALIIPLDQYVRPMQWQATCSLKSTGLKVVNMHSNGGWNSSVSDRSDPARWTPVGAVRQWSRTAVSSDSVIDATVSAKKDWRNRRPRQQQQHSCVTVNLVVTSPVAVARNEVGVRVFVFLEDRRPTRDDRTLMIDSIITLHRAHLQDDHVCRLIIIA